MESMFNELFGIDGVQGVFLLSGKGTAVFKKFKPIMGDLDTKKISEAIGNEIDLNVFTGVLETSDESLLIYTQKRVFIKKAGPHFLFVILDMFAPVAMVRLNCQLIIPEIEKMKAPKGIGRFFKK